MGIPNPSTIYYLWLIDLTCHHSRRDVNRFWLNKSLSRMFVKSSSMPIPSTANDLKRLAFSSQRKTTLRLSQVQVSKTLTKMRSSRSLGLATTNQARSKDDQHEEDCPPRIYLTLIIY